MKIWLASLLIFGSVQALAAKPEGLRFGHSSNPQALYFQEMKVGGKNVFALNFRSPRGSSLVQALPKALFQTKRAELKAWASKFKNQRFIASDFFCADSVEMIFNNETDRICLDRVTAETRREFVQWIESTAELTFAPGRK